MASLETQLREATATVKSTQSELDAITGGFHAAQKEVATLSDALRLAEAEVWRLSVHAFVWLVFDDIVVHDPCS